MVLAVLLFYSAIQHAYWSDKARLIEDHELPSWLQKDLEEVSEKHCSCILYYCYTGEVELNDKPDCENYW